MRLYFHALPWVVVAMVLGAPTVKFLRHLGVPVMRCHCLHCSLFCPCLHGWNFYKELGESLDHCSIILRAFSWSITEYCIDFFALLMWLWHCVYLPCLGSMHCHLGQEDALCKCNDACDVSTVFFISIGSVVPAQKKFSLQITLEI